MELYVNQTPNQMKSIFPRNLSFWLAALFLLFSFTLQAQSKFSAEEWQKDLRYLQNTVHEDFPFLLKKIKAEEFDALVDRLYNEIPQLQEHEIMVGFSRIVSSIKYGHTIFGYWEGVVPYHQMPIVLYEYNDGVFI